MPRSQEAQRGIAFERDVAAALGLQPVPGSGSQWYSKSDAQGRLRVSCKSEKKRTWGQTLCQLAEAVDLAHGTGETPALAVEDPDSGVRCLIFRLEDAAEFLSYESRVERKPRRADSIRNAVRLPALLREED